MQIVESTLMTILIPDKGYKIVNKNTGKCYKKVYLGKMDSVDNYGEVVDEKYICMDYVVEMDELKSSFKEINEQNEMTIDLLLLTIDEIYTSFEPLLSFIPATIDVDCKISKLVNFYTLMVKRNLKDIDDVPNLFREEVMKMLQ